MEAIPDGNNHDEPGMASRNRSGTSFVAGQKQSTDYIAHMLGIGSHGSWRILHKKHSLADWTIVLGFFVFFFPNNFWGECVKTACY